MKIAIIGGGLAGGAAAFMLKNAEHEPVIYEANDSIADGASGNVTGLYNPRFGAQWTPQSQYFSKAFEHACDLFPKLGDIDHDPSGCMHLINDEKKIIRYSKMLESWGWDEDDMQILSQAQTSEICGIETGFQGLWLPRSGTVSPPKLCAAYSDGVFTNTGVRIDDIDAVNADLIILAAGPTLRDTNDTKRIGFQAVRGQVTMVKETEQTKAMKTNICYSGYITKAKDGVHMVGSTFQRWLDHSEIIEQDDVDNLNKLATAIPSFPTELEIVGQRASVRTTSKDHFPVVGQLSDNLYMTTAHGSHGILSSLMAAEILVNMIDNKPQPLSDDVLVALSPHRFSL